LNLRYAGVATAVGATVNALGMLYHRSGLLGVSGISSDMRTLLASEDEQAREAVDLFVFRAAREIGARWAPRKTTRPDTRAPPLTQINRPGDAGCDACWQMYKERLEHNDHHPVTAPRSKHPR
jgi:hypothetical protein